MKDRSGFPFLKLAYFAIFAGFNIWRLTFHNYALEKFQVSAWQIGFLFSLTTIPRVLAFSIGLIAKKVRIFYLLVYSCGLVGMGLIWISLVPSGNILWPGVLSIGLGFTCFYPVVNSLCLMDSKPEKTAILIGRLKSFGPLAATGSALLILFILQPVGFKPFLLLTGTAVILCGGVAALGLRNREYAVFHGSLSFRIILWPYYVLNFLAGWRSALFRTFVLFLLITQYHFKIHGTAIIVLAGNLASFFGYRLIGQLTNRYDQRDVLSSIYIIVTMIFMGFCFIKSPFVLSILFLLDSMLFGASVVTDSYLKRISSPQDLIGDLASGSTLFHLAGVLAPLAGGLLWQHVDQKATFLLGSALASLSILVSRNLDQFVATERRPCKER